jgi:PilZ domain
VNQPGSERRTEPRWPAEAVVHITFQNGAQVDARILNVNLGGCFLEGSYGLQGGETVYLQSQSPHLNGVYAQAVWVVNEPNLQGFGVQFQPMDDSQKFEIIKWFNRLVPDPRARR